ncbi:MAG TPA: histidinol dehydrogenase [Armatimonadota bacterium]|mgnify:CR=1 FL=1|nr:histidinol dehydrogenase [Armatimonadota bacterium]HPP75976.1 histidinol dehydrogenase [Armatimonadota bacterium]
MKIFEIGRDSQAEIDAALAPPERPATEAVEESTKSIIADVKSRGDQALLELGQRFDSPELTSIAVTEDEFQDAYEKIDTKLIAAIRRAKANIEEYHRKQLKQSWIDVRDGITLGQIIRPIERVGMYAPGGKAPYPSTVLMTAVPAKVAGVPFFVMCSPAQADGKMDPLTLIAARESGVDSVFKIGGAQAIAAMAYGTATVPKVDKIVGPGNPYVAEAKRQLFGVVGIDMIAGPSEIMVIADNSAEPHFVAIDLLSQAEHAEDSRIVLVTITRDMADKILAEVKRLRSTAARREIIAESLSENGVVVLARTHEEAAELANQFAPEHLELMVSDPWAMLPLIKNAGAIMMGRYSPVPLGDYAAGPSHTLPTAGTARFSSPLGVDDFIKRSSLVSYSRDALREIAATVIDLAEAEGFTAHADSVRIRVHPKEEV